MDNTPLLSLPLLAHKQALQTTFHDDAMKTLDALVMLSVIDRDLSSPPASPDEGDRYIVKAPGSGDPAWADDNVVVFIDGHWLAHEPRPGWTCYVQDEGALIAWNGTAWQPAIEVLGAAAIQNLALLGVGTTADAVNPFSAKLNNALWTARTVAEGGDGDLRYKLSKENAAKTLSLLLQDNLSGRAEIGLTGDDDLHLKVSADGSNWLDALLIDRATGKLALGQGFASPATARAQLSAAPADAIAKVNVLTPHEGLVNKRASDATVSCVADGLVLFDGGGNPKRFSALNATVDITASGANGLDTGAEAGSTWYHIHAIGKPDGTVNALLSASATSPVLPSGYTHSGYIGAVYNNGSSNFAKFFQTGRDVACGPAAVVSNGAQTSFTAISLADVLPPTATGCSGYVFLFTSSGTAAVTANFAADGSGTTSTYGGDTVMQEASIGTTQCIRPLPTIILSTPQQMKYYVQGTNALVTLHITTYRF